MLWIDTMHEACYEEGRVRSVARIVWLWCLIDDVV